MKTKIAFLTVFVIALIASVLNAQQLIQKDSLDSVLRTKKNPKEKVDLILKFLDKPENQNLENSEDITERAYQIAVQANYAEGKIRAMLKLGNYYFRISDYKKAIEYAQKSEEMAEDLNMDKELASSLSLYGAIFTDLSDYDNSSRYFFKSLEIFEKLDDKVGISRSLGDIGMGFFLQGDYKKSLEYYNKALLLAYKIDNNSAIKKELNNIAALYSTLGKYDTAVILLKKAITINRKLGDKLGESTNIRNIGYIQLNRKEYKEALSSFEQSLELVSDLNNLRHNAECYANLGFSYYAMNQYEESIYYFNMALKDGQEIKNYSIVSPVAKMLNEIYTQQKDTIKAYKYLSIEKSADDSLYFSQNEKHLYKLEVKYLYEKKEFEKNQEQRIKNIIYISLILSLLGGVVFLIQILSKNKLKSKLINSEKEKIELELINKDKELTINMLSLLKKNELLSEISKKLHNIQISNKNTENKEVINQISKQLITSTDDKILKEFSLRFQEVHAGFYEKLLLKYPGLTQSELKLCAFLRLNMSTKDIAELTGQEMNTILKARQRLRNRLEISGTETNLAIFLSQF
ncbi:MAG: tetratricopeptide repeat protein [Lentimicrobium sp.]|jgi:tetratricopeptide (TPR) repeat protein|nr:tetratricopeptide repeat protein [Lentimicrobium sp.]